MSDERTIGQRKWEARRGNPSRFAFLSGLEERCLRLYGEGLSSAAIAAEVGHTRDTVRHALRAGGEKLAREEARSLARQREARDLVAAAKNCRVEEVRRIEVLDTGEWRDCTFEAWRSREGSDRAPVVDAQGRPVAAHPTIVDPADLIGPAGVAWRVPRERVRVGSSAG